MPRMAVQVGPARMYRDGIARSLDRLANLAKVNELHAYPNTYHLYGKPNPTLFGLEGTDLTQRPIGNPALWTRTDDRFYTDTTIRHRHQPPESGPGTDYFADLLREATPRGMRVMARWCDWANGSTLMTGWESCHVIDAEGGPRPQWCHRHPSVVGWWAGQARDLVSLYPDLGGIHYGKEQRGPLACTLSGWGTTCFCPVCVTAARQANVDPERAREGYRALSAWVIARKDGQPTRDGAFVEVMALFFRYPEILAWDRLWYLGLIDLKRAMYRAVKAANPQAEVGWHLWQMHSFSPLLRASFDLGALADCTDWVKPVLYHECGGVRFHAWTAEDRATWLQDLPLNEVDGILHRILGDDPATTPSGPAHAAYGPDYITRETQRTIAALPGIPVLPGISIGHPEGVPGLDHIAPAFAAALAAGAAGVVICREFEEMTDEQLREVGRIM